MNKKIVSGILALAIVASLGTTVFAEPTNPSSGTLSVTYVGQSEELWEVTIPAIYSNNGHDENGYFTASGQWGADKKLVVSCPEYVDIVNENGTSVRVGLSPFNGYGTFEDEGISKQVVISQVGDDLAPVDEISEGITAMFQMPEVVFGTFTGSVTVDVSLEDVE